MIVVVAAAVPFWALSARCGREEAVEWRVS